MARLCTRTIEQEEYTEAIRNTLEDNANHNKDDNGLSKHGCFRHAKEPQDPWWRWYTVEGIALCDAVRQWFSVTVNLPRKTSTEIATVIKPLLAVQAALNQIPLRVPNRVLTVPLRLLVLPRESQQQQYLSIDGYIAAALCLHSCFVNIRERTI